ncbi:MAG TPA: DNA internalization-related competence protein ComEC/Rec2 [Kiritimatiellia bacterium]|nr:DNA internalization-related competence protein ComEC/Rec2 [Kiritimatiellia bacterium]HQQ03526.1 DNA internalization-related competence protein ComEC/Rec2 [Kiritimatiellia bacterium]
MKSSPPSEYLPGPRRPLVGLAVAVMAGCLAGLRGPPCFLLPAVTAFVLTVAAMVFRKHPAAGAAVYAALVLTAAAHTSLLHHSPSRRDVRSMMRHSREYLQLMGVVTDDPESEPGFGRFSTSWSFTLKLEGVRRREQWQAARGRVFVRISLPEADPPLRYGDRLIVEGLLKNLASPRAWLPPVTMEGEDGRTRILSGGNGSRLKGWCYAGRARFSLVLSRGLENYPDIRGLLEALLLGYRSALPDNLRDVFALTGTLHIFAISGLHVGVMAILIIAVLKMLGISRQYWILLLGPALILYVMGTGLKASAARACIMALLYWSGPLFKRRPDGGSTLAAAAILILAADPRQIASPGFILSFSVVAGIILFYPVFRRLYTLPLRKPRWIPGPRPRLERWGRFLAEKAADLAAVSTAAWLVSAPTTAYYFNLCSPIGLLGNIFIVPGSFLVVLTGCLSLVTGSLFPVCAEIFNHANRVFVDLLLWIVRLMSSIPHGHSHVQSPSPLLMLLWYITLSALVFMRMGFRKIFFCGILIASLAAFSLAWYRQDVAIDVLDVGEGNAVFMNLPRDGDILIDTGPHYFANRVIRHLQAEGVDRLETVVLTHPDADHTGGAEAVMDRFEVGEVWVCPFKGQSERYERMLEKVRARGIRVRRLERGLRGTAAGDVVWEVFSPEGTKNFRIANEASLVMRFGRKAAAILFMGGAGISEERAMLQAGIQPAAGILVLGDHGSEKTTSDEWLTAVSPRLAVISVGRNNRRGDPSPTVVQRLDSRNIERWRTDLQGSLRITLPDDPQAAPWIVGPVPNK